MERILEWMRAQGFEKAELAVFATNARARRLYESLGFVEEGVRRSHVRIRGAYVDEVRMGLWLGSEVSCGVARETLNSSIGYASAGRYLILMSYIVQSSYQHSN